MSHRSPRLPPNTQDAQAMLLWVYEEFRHLADQVHDVELLPQTAAPNKPHDYRMYFADGTNWNPGSGRGVYLFDPVGPTWRFLG